MSEELEERYLPDPKKRQTHAVCNTPEEALQEGRDLVYLLNGIPRGFKMTVFERMGKYVLCSYPDPRYD